MRKFVKVAQKIPNQFSKQKYSEKISNKFWRKKSPHKCFRICFLILFFWRRKILEGMNFVLPRLSCGPLEGRVSLSDERVEVVVDNFILLLIELFFFVAHINYMLLRWWSTDPRRPPRPPSSSSKRSSASSTRFFFFTRSSIRADWWPRCWWRCLQGCQ